MENSKNIQRKIREIVKDYESKGYTVFQYPIKSELPDFLKSFDPDILARKENENVIIEVKTRNNRTDLTRFESLAKEIDKRENWRFEMVFTNPKEKQIKTEHQNILSDNKISERITEIEKLIGIESYEAAFLLSWATIESVLRNKLIREKLNSENTTTLSLIKAMFSLGLVNQHDYKSLQESFNQRNSLIHGFEQYIDQASVKNVLKLVNNLTGRNEESYWLDWLNAVDLENYEEIYSLYLTALNQEDYGLFSVLIDTDKIIIKAHHMDDVLEFENEDKLREFADFVEEEYMDEMGADGWYAFHRAMEKDD